MYLVDKYSIRTDRILFALSIVSGGSSSFTINDATNGAKLKTDLTSYNYLITKYTIWSQNGILDVTIKPDNEALDQIKTLAFTKAIEAPVIPSKLILTDLIVDVTNNQSIDDDLVLSLDIYKVPQDKMSDLIDIGKVISTSLDNIDIQTLGIEKYLIYTNELLKALIVASGGKLPGDITQYVNESPADLRYSPEKTKVCRRA